MRIDAKGKYYTKRVSTDELAVVVRTKHGTIHGFIHIHPNNRLSDEVEREGTFLPLTDVHVEAADGTSFKTEFLALNKDAAIWITPAEAMEEIHDDR